MTPLAPPQLRWFADLSVRVGTPHEIGSTPAGNRRVIPIVGGEVQGEGWTGRVLSGGADFQAIVSPTLAQLDARYVIETEAGELVFVANRAIRVAAPEVTARLVRGEPVDPADVYFRCVPSFETSAPSLAWINERVFVGTGVRRPDEVRMTFFQMD
ncbi:DUF3237 domain-containing protein [Ramlibacter ginsenosidimutans]|uniref:UPF0311 protein JJB11_09365 n=1 Tax=Ramlibacter ginsenosidimutans TaxID=502333 RepID=A0A934TRK9_9BURK|nr:DUF3237 domain-containing protein [Ramlibacter ginsenosidimutans]MBK6006297.1 DUF3237 domain-containing protein [Ramlibacter ginsenosidimutans]